MSGAEDLARTESAAALAKKIRRKEVSPLEVLDTAIERIEAHNPKINALVIFGYDDARKAAKAAEAAIMRGDAVGPLHGVPIAMKDCFDYKPGWVTTYGGIRALRTMSSTHTACSWSAWSGPGRSSSERPTARCSGSAAPATGGGWGGGGPAGVILPGGERRGLGSEGDRSLGVGLDLRWGERMPSVRAWLGGGEGGGEWRGSGDRRAGFVAHAARVAKGTGLDGEGGDDAGN